LVEPTTSKSEFGQFKFPETAKVLHITQEHFDMMVNDFEDEHGYYPDT
jgi:hypothetical protein